MNQDSRFATTRPCCHHDIFRLFVIDNLTLAVGEFTEEFVVFGRSDILIYLRPTFFFEILIDELAEIKCKVVVHESKCCIIVTNHQVSIFTHNMNLAYTLFVEFIQ